MSEQDNTLQEKLEKKARKTTKKSSQGTKKTN